VRPTDVSRTPKEVGRYLGDEQKRLYELIWKRAVASQMQSAELDQVIVEIAEPAGRARLRATGSIVAFDGYLKLYTEGRDDTEAAGDEDSRMLPPMREQDPLTRGAVAADQHFTQPPPRFSEASLVKKMEELGIGRPSTYASILTVLRDRDYVRLEARRFIPEDRGRLVTAFLTSFFERYVDPHFTAGLEEQLDDISDGRADWRAVMAKFWEAFSHAVAQTKDLKISDVIDALDADLGPHFFPAKADGTDPRVCTACGTGRLGLKLGRYGSFIGCSNYPACQFTRRLVIDAKEGEGGETLKDGMRALGTHPETGEEVVVKRGPWGLYVQQGEPDPNDKKAKPRRATLPKGFEGDTVTLDQAVGLLSLPRLVGLHPELGEPIEAGIGRFGPYVKMGAIFASLDKDDNILLVGMNRAMDVLGKKLASVRTLGEHPKDREPILVRKGRFGPYVQHGQMVANLPRERTMEDFTLEEALPLLAEKGKALKPRGKKGAAVKAKPARKPAAKSAATAPVERKTPARKAAAKAPAAKAPATKVAAKSTGKAAQKTAKKPA
jgi:DNA topoisomerase-1